MHIVCASGSVQLDSKTLIVFNEVSTNQYEAETLNPSTHPKCVGVEVKGRHRRLIWFIYNERRREFGNERVKEKSGRWNGKEKKNKRMRERKRASLDNKVKKE